MALEHLKKKTPEEMEELINISNTNVGEDLIQTVNARDLHTFLGVGKNFSNWIKDRIEMYGFTENVDYIISEILSSPNLASTKARPQLKKEYYVSLEMAKELSMVDRGEKWGNTFYFVMDDEGKLDNYYSYRFEIVKEE